MSDANTISAKRRKIVTASLADDGAAVEFSVHAPTTGFPVANAVVFNVADIPTAKRDWYAIYGVWQIVRNITNRIEEGASTDAINKALSSTLDSIRDGTYTPGRAFAVGEREPTDLELAIAEVTGQSVEDVIERIETELVRNDDGTLKLTSNGRTMRVYTQRMLDAIAADPAIKPVLAKHVAARAKRLSDEARASKGGESALSTLFGSKPIVPAEPVAEAAQ